ncbi:MAG: class I SAM-dependent methyltransferase, partial [Chthoniobacteraceae bacterium]
MCQACFTVLPTDQFGEKLVGIINSAGLALMISIGHRTGLFDTLATLPASTSAEIAEAAGLNERYVREWLGAMTVGGIIRCEPDGPRFSLPAEHAACLTRDAGADNIAVFTQYIAVLGGVEDKVVRCFREGGGVPYSDFPRFHEVMAEDSAQSVGSSLLNVILPAIRGLIERLEQGIEVLDIGCGSGRILNLFARSFPNSQFVGYDLSDEALNTARREAREAGLRNLRFEQRDLTNFHEEAAPAEFDLITAFDAIHDQARPDQVLAGIRTALRRDGLFLMQDIGGSSSPDKNFDRPLGPLLYTISCMHCMTVSLAQGGLG